MENSKIKRNIKPFDGEKYSVWKFRIRALLSEMDVIRVIDDDPIIRCKEWEKNNRIAKSVIVEYLSDSYLGFAKENSSAREILKSLDALYERKSLATQLALRKKLLALKLQGDVPLVKHFATFDDLVTELLAAGARLDETDKVAHLLLTLPATYDGVITAIETLSEDSLTLAFVKTRLLDHEVKLKNESSDTSAKVLHVENKTESFKRRKVENTRNQSNYYQKDNKKGKRKSNFVKCHHCGRKGHVKNDCFYFKRMNQQKNTDRTRTVQAVELTPAQSSTSSNISGFAFMTGDYQDVEIQENKITFLLDSGASDHITNREDLFSNCTNLSTPFKISVAKSGEFISATKKGTINVMSNMGIQGSLEDVLYCPEAPYNLLSVSKMQRAGLTVIFNQEGAQVCKDGKIIMRDDNGQYYFCTLCEKKFHSRSQVIYHAYCNGQPKPYQCLECNKSFATHSHYKYHMRVHRNERTYACEVCGDSFFQMSKLQRHKLKHTKEKKFSCTICEKGFNNLTALRQHGLTHTEERPFACKKCDRRFRDKSNYRKHILKHEDIKCSCQECGREVCSRRALQYHARSQHERRAFQCPRCPQAFHSNKDMRRHAQVHTDSKPFRCKVCSRFFRRKDNLERHIRNTHPDYVPAAAVECDPQSLVEIVMSNGQNKVIQSAEKQTEEKEQMNETHEKTKLEMLNPLPPMPKEVIQEHIKETTNKDETVDKVADTKTATDKPLSTIDKSYILEANNARQSVIVGKCVERKVTSPATEYVHKIRKANSMRSQKDALPPIDEKKMIELQTKTNLNVLDVGAPLPKNIEIYKNILYGKEEREGNEEELKIQECDTGPKRHWKRKMKLNINW